MCSACGFPSRPGHWTDAGAVRPGSRLRLRFTRLAIVNRLLAPYKLTAHDDGATPGLQLMAPDGERVAPSGCDEGRAPASEEMRGAGAGATGVCQAARSVPGRR